MDYAEQSLALSEQINYKKGIASSINNIGNVYEKQGNKQALENYKLYIATRDSLVNKENTRKIVQQQMQYEFDKKIGGKSRTGKERKPKTTRKETKNCCSTLNQFVLKCCNFGMTTYGIKLNKWPLF